MARINQHEKEQECWTSEHSHFFLIICFVVAIITLTGQRTLLTSTSIYLPESFLYIGEVINEFLLSFNINSVEIKQQPKSVIYKACL